MALITIEFYYESHPYDHSTKKFSPERINEINKALQSLYDDFAGEINKEGGVLRVKLVKPMADADFFTVQTAFLNVSDDLSFRIRKSQEDDSEEI